MFPIRDENPKLHTSVVTFGIIALNVAAWIFVQQFGVGRGFLRSVCVYGLIPGELLGTAPAGMLIPIGQGLGCVIGENPNWLTPLTSMFMHGGWFHLIGNMWFLAIFGDNVEDVMGPFKFFVFYILCGLAAAAAQVISGPASVVPMVGASGAIGGVMGAYAMLFPRAPVHMLVFFGFFITRVVVPAVLMLGYWFVLQLLGGMVAAGHGGVAFWAHIGGFVAGIMLLKPFCNPRRVADCRRRRGRTHRIVHRYRS